MAGLENRRWGDASLERHTAHTTRHAITPLLERPDSDVVRVAIVGGGWAGLACAETLQRTWQAQSTARLDHMGAAPRLQITLFESAPHCGGRARGLVWEPTPGSPLFIDNGQHLTVGAYTHTWALLARARAPAWETSPLIWASVKENAVRKRQWTVSPLGLVARVLSSLAGPYAPKGWPLAWRLSLARSVMAMARQGWRDSTRSSVAAWLHHQRVPQGLIDHFWQPLTEGALNTEIKAASLHVLMHVVKDALLGAAGTATLRTPHSNLSMDGVTPIAQHVEKQGAELTLGARVSAIAQQQKLFSLTVRQAGADREHKADAVVLALPAHATRRLWQDSSLAETPASRRWGKLETRAITTVWVACTPAQLARVQHLPPWFVLEPLAGTPHVAQVVVKRTGVLAFVISAQQRGGDHAAHDTGADTDANTNADTNANTNADADASAMRAALQQQIQRQLGLDLSAQPQKWITEKTATWACTADAPWPETTEVTGETGLAGIFRAADDLEPGYPATIESAVRSGERTAQSVVNYLRSRS